MVKQATPHPNKKMNTLPGKWVICKCMGHSNILNPRSYKTISSQGKLFTQTYTHVNTKSL